MTHHPRHNGGRIRPRGDRWQAEIRVDGRPRRCTRDTQAECRDWIDQQRDAVDRGEPVLDAVDMRDARQARGILPDDVSLVEAARFYVRSRRPATSVAVNTAIDQYVDLKRLAGRRPRTIQTVEATLRRFARQFGPHLMDDVTAEQVIAWMRDLGLRGRTWNNHRRDLHGLFNWAARNEMIRRNPIETVPIVALDRTSPAVLTVADTRAVLTAAAGGPLRPYFAIGLFAGLRPEAEIRRLTWADVDPQAGGVIHVRGAATKTRTQERYVTITGTLAEWLDGCRLGGLVVPLRGKRFHEAFRAVVAASGVTWSQDVMRHSYASYHLAAHGSADQTAAQLGHRGTNLLFSTYRRLVTQEAAAEYWALTPSAVLDK